VVASLALSGAVAMPFVRTRPAPRAPSPRAPRPARGVRTGGTAAGWRWR